MKKRYLFLLLIGFLLTACTSDGPGLDEKNQPAQVEREKKVEFRELEDEIKLDKKDIIRYGQEDLKALKHSNLHIYDFRDDILYGLGHDKIVQPFKVSFKNGAQEADMDEKYSFVDGIYNPEDRNAYYFIKDDKKKTVMRLDMDNLRLRELDGLEDDKVTQLLGVWDRDYSYLSQDGDSISYRYRGWDEYDDDFFTDESNMLGMSYYGKNIKLDRMSKYILSQEKRDSAYRGLMVSDSHGSMEFEADLELDFVGFENNMIILEGEDEENRKLYIYHTVLRELMEPLNIASAVGKVVYKNGKISYLTDSGHIRVLNMISGGKKYISLKNLDEDLNKVDIEAYGFRDAFYIKVRDLDAKNPDRFYQLRLGDNL